FGDLRRVVDGLPLGQRRLADARAKRLALEELRYDVRRAVVGADVVDAEDVGVIERAGSARFLLEPAEAVCGFRESGRQDFHGHFASQPRVVGAIDLAHASGAEGRHDFVRSETRSGGQAHPLDYAPPGWRRVARRSYRSPESALLCTLSTRLRYVPQ